MNEDVRLEILAEDARDADRLDEDGYERMVNGLNALSLHELAKVVIKFGDLDKDIVTSHQRSKRHQIARQVIEALYLTIYYLTDERLVELLLKNFDEIVRDDLKNVVLRGVRRCKFVVGDLTYRDLSRVLIAVIVLDMIMNAFELPADH